MRLVSLTGRGCFEEFETAVTAVPQLPALGSSEYDTRL